MARRSIAYCGCGNISVDGLNFTRVEDAGIPTLQCARCGATSSEFEYLNRSEVEPLVKAARGVIYAPTQDVLGDRISDLADALKSFEDPQ